MSTSGHSNHLSPGFKVRVGSKNYFSFFSTKTYVVGIVRPSNRDWACQTEHCHTLSNKISLQ